ncbi:MULTISPECIES: UDP-N-acetylmuramoyl-tripeptide--D-alanyl-D-alanine ligase [unclassified Oceanispirochaeta]|uniref:UDP-N-acetylmuramoyl-tripeptide--D-alanyl-D- alanine ligase n=1 Tax=unclassified Oceanispirochaeta TaxID=2635722 RepID=UPI000E09A414|nr:UDP-N-acetylmuramoyl-tripeptide--D-alanyl-D-alanine ligase [Oceanispirochaeta sp. M1]MBF9016135.1 UDP-N-acetylmuramoyl-tripeptide--D-alanyl-D-alanine ligase [Oceanispirochaeta sp. M2]NPD72597.1 UDP-N-acetylmuramoyl-tripeptide--D-alanyl-D-alanine ligase [Oceanispirochaeta sp. M1]RDG31749.1 UDP-N-acetylmuramoyl-tripeptide--D-alanyl-D-alanine ligase [Oceanispirochaeta sp. M1]
MTSPFGVTKLLKLSEGFFLGDRNKWREPHYICIDSRDARPDTLFVPLKGERTDGHLHIKSAIEGGSTAVLVEKVWAENHTATLQDWASAYDVLFFPVDDTLKHMQILASRHRQLFKDLKVVGVTGSNGKTTTKEMIASILETMGSTYKNPGNLNSEIGLPLTVLRMNKQYEYAVLEMGINHIGEMDILVDIARPDTAVITNVGTAHIGYLGSQRRIAEEKRKIFSLQDSSGKAFIYENESFADVLFENAQGETLRFGVKSIPELLEVIDLGLEGQKLVFTDCTVTLALPGIHNLNNALAATAVCRSLGADWNHIRIGLGKLSAVFGRSEILKGKVDIIQDCYNANPDSVMAAVRMLVDLPSGGRRLLVLGDMLELGEESHTSHSNLGRALTDSSVDEVFFFGPEMKAAAREYGLSGKNAFCTDDYRILEQQVLGTVEPGDLLLLKGSRGMELERLTAPLLKGMSSESVLKS